METNPAAKETKMAEHPKNTWKDYIGWAGFVVTIGVLLEQLYVYADWFWYYSFGSGFKVLGIIADSQYSPLTRIVNGYDVVTVLFYIAYPLTTLILLLFRKKIVPKLLVIFICVAMFTNITGVVFDFLLAAEYQETASIDLRTIVFLGIDILLLLFYAKSKRFKALFVK